MAFKTFALVGIGLAFMAASPVSAQMSKAEALSEVERQLNQWKSQGRIDDIKIISTHGSSLKKQVRAGRIDLQAIVDTHNYSHKDGKFYGQTPPKRELKKRSSAQTAIISKPPVISQSRTSIPSANRPIGAYTRLEESWVGFPAMLTYKAKLGLVFPNGNFVSCANWDPAVLDPTPESVGRAIKKCDVTKWQGSQEKKTKGFSKGQTLDIKFGNVSANGFDWGSSSSSQISGSNLLMTKSGRIAIGKYRGTSVSSGGNGAGSSSRTRPLTGTYVLDDYIITITTNRGEVVNGFIAWSSDRGSRKIDHIYLNGEHFWNRKK